MDCQRFARLKPLVQEGGLKKLASTSVFLCGVGGVGSWCAEALARSGVGRIQLVDPDTVSFTNTNRQVQATDLNYGKSKVESLCQRLESINPDAQLTPCMKEYSLDTASGFDLNEYDYVLDVLDSPKNKSLLIANALDCDTVLFSSMGAACKLDPTLVRIESFWKIERCPLAKAVRKEMRRRNVEGDFTCVYSPENLMSRTKKGGDVAKGPASVKKGTAVQVTGVFGFYLASLVMNHAVADFVLSPA